MATTKDMLREAQRLLDGGDIGEAMECVRFVGQIMVDSERPGSGSHHWRCKILIDIPGSRPADRWEFIYMANVLTHAIGGAIRAAYEESRL